MALIALLAALAAATTASGYWTGYGASLQGTGAGGAATVSNGAAPTVSPAGVASAVLTWGSSTLSNGLPVDGYRVTRYDSASGAAQVMGSGCGGVVSTESCTETGLSPGTWRYTVTPMFASHWAGAESTKSGAISIGAATLSLDDSLFGAPLPAETTGTAAGFQPGESVAYSVGGVSSTGSPTTADASGAVTITALTIPALADGPHTVRLTGATSGLVAAAAVVTDTAPPVLSTVVSPTPNAAGWNRTPVEVSGSADDGIGSGLDFVKATTDGSDPRTSPTASLYEGVPVPIGQTTTIRFYGVDFAGNATAVQTLPVNIDTIPPAFYPQIVDVTGGAVITTLPPNPGVAYYRGGSAGSFRFRITPSDTGGSGVASVATSSLVDVTTGFTHEPGAFADPGGGAVLTNPFSWVAGTTSTPVGTVTVTDVAGNTSSGGGTLYNDSAAPTGGAVDATGLHGVGGRPGRFSASTTLTLGLTPGTDIASGLAPTGAQLLRASAPLSSTDGVAVGTCGTYGAYAAVGAGDLTATTTDTVPTDNRCYRYQYAVPDQVGNVATATSGDIMVQTAAPSSLTPSGVQITPVSGLENQSVSGSTLYYQPTQAGSFTVAANASDASSGVAWMSFPAPTGFTGGGAVGPQGTGTTFRTTYAWTGNAASPSPGGQTIAATDNAGLSPVLGNAITLLKDVTPPSGGSVEVSGLGGSDGRYATSTTLSVGLSPGTDAGSGVAATGRQLLRASAALTSDGTSNGVCGTYGAYTQVGVGDPSSPVTDTVPVDRTCYRYRYAVSDKVGNAASSTSPDVKVDSAGPPPPTLTYSNLSNTSANGNAILYRPTAGSGGFTVTATSADTTAGTTTYDFPTLPAGWTSVSGGAGVRIYSWSAPNPTAPTGTLLVGAHNNAGSLSTTAFTVTASADITAPTGGSVSYVNGYSTNPAINVSFTKGSDAGTGIAPASGLLQRASATLSNTACGTFGAFATVAGDPTSAYSDPVTTGCYQYRYRISDNVGNQATYTSPSIAKVDQLPPTNTVTITNATGAYSAFGGASLYFKGNAAGSFTYVDAVSDAESGPASADFPAIATTGWTHAAQTVSTPTGGPYVSSAYSWTANPATPPLFGLVGRDAAGKVWSAIVTFVNDSSPPTSGSVSSPNALLTAATVPISLNNGTDGASGVNAATTVIKRDVATLTTATETCGAFPGTFATTVTLVGGADTSVTTGHCYQYRYLVSDNVGNVTTYSSANVTRVDTSGPRVTAITSLQSNGAAGNGQLQVGDKLVLTFNQSLASASVPASFAGATERSPGPGLNVTLTIPGITNGARDTGSPSYVATSSTTATFAGTVALAGSATSTTVTLTVTSLTGAATAVSAGTLVFAPSATILDGGGNPAGGTFSTSSGFRLF